MTQVNRYLKDKAMDHIDHALGRPLDPMEISFRNYFVIDADNCDAEGMRTSSYWQEGRAVGGMTSFHVTDAGRRALAEHLRAVNDPHRAFVITFNGGEATVVSTSPAKARYSCWLSVSDTRPDLEFSEFLRSSKVRRAA